MLVRALVLLSLAACQTVYMTPEATPERVEESLRIPIDRHTGKPLLEVAPPDGYRGQGFESTGPRTSGLSSSTEVWAVTGRWYNVTPEAGIAWPADSGLTWDEKYAAWVDAMGPTTGDDGHVTVQMIAPWTDSLPAPRLECAEMAMFLRATFASWYGLPFFMTAWHPDVGDLHMGHFGVVDSEGRRVTGYPSYSTSYVDHTASYSGGAWPSDTALHAKALTTLLDDHNDHLGPDAYSGAYFDTMFLNKRMGHFLVSLLTNNGSMHLASARNTWDLDPDEMRQGDFSVQRWSDYGIGHVVILKEVDEVDGQLDVDIVYGSMPRIQPKWYDEAIGSAYLTSRSAGSGDQDYTGTRYSEYGGGLKRWRAPVVLGGRWLNAVPVSDRGAYIADDDYTALEARPDRIDALLGNKTPEEQRDALLERIEIAREALRHTPASCANRTRREEAFDELYVLMAGSFGTARSDVDSTYRILEDYVFAELDYEQSKTCCWNATTPDMWGIIMDFADEEVDADTCVEPTVFKARNNGYDLWANYAADTGRAGQWKTWSADELPPTGRRLRQGDGGRGGLLRGWQQRAHPRACRRARARGRRSGLQRHHLRRRVRRRHGHVVRRGHAVPLQLPEPPKLWLG
jgi:hypothetical protein